jgi:hypothetical protein
VPQGLSNGSQKGFDVGALLLLVILVNYGLTAIFVSIFLLDHGRAVPWLPLLDHGGMITIAVAVLIVWLANSYASADRADVNTNFIRQRGGRDRRQSWRQLFILQCGWAGLSKNRGAPYGKSALEPFAIR